MPTTYNFTVKTTDAQGLTCEKPQSITVNTVTKCDVACNKRFRIKGYVDGIFTMVCSAAVGPPWPGTFPVGDPGGLCNCAYSAGVGSFVISGQQCLAPRLFAYDPTGPVDCSQGYYLYIQCALGGATMWLGFCAATSPGNDCPTGIYVRIGGAAGAPLGLEIEEY